MDRKKLLNIFYDMKDTDWLKSNVVAITYIVMGSIVYWVNPYNNLLSVVLVCGLSSLISSILYIKGIDRGIDLTREARLDAIEEEQLRIRNLKRFSEKTKKNITRATKREANRKAV
jgi:hypothetical protein